jgi:fructokinase
MTRFRIGIDLGGSKTLGALFDRAGREQAREIRTTPAHDYHATIETIVDIISKLEAGIGQSASIGIGTPGALSPATGVMHNANSTWLNGRPFGQDLTSALDRPVRLANDANCFTLSEAMDGAGAAAKTVFGVILGTGCGGGIVIGKRLLDGPQAIAGEWGHTPLPWPDDKEHPGPRCWCGKRGCLETWLSGPGLAADHQTATGETLSAETIAARAAAGGKPARASLDRHADRLARGLAVVITLLDPELIVLGGGLANMAHLYEDVPGLLPKYVFSDHVATRLAAPHHGPESGVRGAAWLWNDD